MTLEESSTKLHFYFYKYKTLSSLLVKYLAKSYLTHIILGLDNKVYCDISSSYNLHWNPIYLIPNNYLLHLSLVIPKSLDYHKIDKLLPYGLKYEIGKTIVNLFTNNNPINCLYPSKVITKELGLDILEKEKTPDGVAKRLLYYPCNVEYVSQTLLELS